MSSVRAAIAACVIAVGGLAPSVGAHPGHVAVAEIERDAEKNALEVAIRLYPEDLEKALSARTGTKVVIEETEGIDALIASYLDDRLLVAPPGEMPSEDWRPPVEHDEEGHPIPRLTLIGKEFERRDLWVYAEIRLPRGMATLENAWIRNRVLSDEVHGHDNICRIRDGALRASIRATPKTGWTLISADPED